MSDAFKTNKRSFHKPETETGTEPKKTGSGTGTLKIFGTVTD